MFTKAVVAAFASFYLARSVAGVPLSFESNNFEAAHALHEFHARHKSYAHVARFHHQANSTSTTSSTVTPTATSNDPTSTGCSEEGDSADDESEDVESTCSDDDDDADSVDGSVDDDADSVDGSVDDSDDIEECDDGSSTTSTTATATPTSTESTLPVLNPTTTTTSTTADSTPTITTQSTGSNLPSSIVGQVYKGGKGTFYYQEGNPGACGAWNSDSTPICALNQDQFNSLSSNGAMPSQWCGIQLNITNTDTGAWTLSTVVDMCPGCGTNGIDLSTGTFDQLGPESQGVLNIEWYAVADTGKIQF